MIQQLSYRAALNLAIRQEMTRDDRVFLFGLDVDDHKEIYGTTRGLLKEFGPQRCFSTPLSEDAMTGMALGAALSGLRPIHVHIRVDFLMLGMNQITNMISAMRYLSGGKVHVPLVIRAVVGRGWGQGAQHSKSLHSVFAHFPGLKVIAPATAGEAHGMLISAIRDENPVIVLEHRWLYDIEGPVDDSSQGIPLGPPGLVRSGSDVTIIATSWMNVEAMLAADILAKRGVSVEILNARSISPLEDRPLLESCERTRHCIVADNDWTYCGFGAELSARIMEKCFGKLRSPVMRIGWPHTPCPTTRILETAFYPNSHTLVRAIEDTLDLEPADLSEFDFYTYENRFKGPF